MPGLSFNHVLWKNLDVKELIFLVSKSIYFGWECNDFCILGLWTHTLWGIRLWEPFVIESPRRENPGRRLWIPIHLVQVRAWVSLRVVISNFQDHWIVAHRWFQRVLGGLDFDQFWLLLLSKHLWRIEDLLWSLIWINGVELSLRALVVDILSVNSFVVWILILTQWILFVILLIRSGDWLQSRLPWLICEVISYLMLCRSRLVDIVSTDVLSTDVLLDLKFE